MSAARTKATARRNTATSNAPSPDLNDVSSDGRTNYSTPALEKGLDVLELLARQRDGLTKSEIARRLDRTISEIFRMLVTLERRGYIAIVDGERYALTLQLFRLVQEHPPTERLLADALPVIERLAHDAQQSCHLGVVEDARVVILAQVNPPTPVGFYVKPGSAIDLMEAASGYVILAHMEQAALQRTLAEWTRQTGSKPPRDLAQHLTRIRKAGFEKRDSYQVKGVVNISFPVLDSRNSAIGALTIPYIQQKDAATPLAKVIDLSRDAAAEITRAIGGHA
ncbi:transcriptional regulator, IclR family [Bryocella elongata]|uniref:Transcriptional regulator, IclR family n=1 Tax=Bryocella elongata TaxID=863522 RepID=A0A1H6C1W3_9BACT|nr:IclR family transcriptional regulator [Bryocella elongata]SEG67000.1 transcriptional regulator, IclR family [Bryocella elongata]